MKIFLLVAVVALVAVYAKDDLVNLAADNPRLAVALFKQFEEREGRPQVPAERKMRLKIFRKNIKEAAALNDAEEDVTYGLTLFADMTDAEVQTYLGVNATTMPDEEFPMQEEPEGLQSLQAGSYSHKGRYPSVKRQLASDCWAFGTISVLEGYTQMYNRRYTELSEQEVIDCTSGSSAAHGGWSNQALSQIRGRGSHMATRASYRYTHRDGRCAYRNHANALPFTISGVYQARGDSGLATALRSGPVAAAAMKFSSDLIRYYKGGIYKNSGCDRLRSGNHAVAATGYSSTWFEIRNSWGSTWGSRGYGYFTRSTSNKCNVSGYSFYLRTARRGQEELEE